MAEWVFSIRPEFVDEIVRGVKRWEFRTCCSGPQSGDVVHVYEILPVGKITGWFEIGEVLRPLERAHREQFSEQEWLDASSMEQPVTALQIRDFVPSPPRPLSDFGLTHAPQRYMRLKEQEVL